jgi:hypothetical protein
MNVGVRRFMFTTLWGAEHRLSTWGLTQTCATQTMGNKEHAMIKPALALSLAFAFICFDGSHDADAPDRSAR